MVEPFSDQYDSWDWFQQGKDGILQSLSQRKTCSHAQNKRQKSKFAPISEIIPTDMLEEILNLQNLGMFLYLNTKSKPDFFANQIGPDDDMERVLIYTRILVTLCDLDLPGFHHDLLRKIAGCKPLLDHFLSIVRKLCTKSFRTMWSDLDRVDRIIVNLQTLLLQTQRAEAMDGDAMDILLQIWRLLTNNENPMIEERPACKHFLQQLNDLFCGDEDKTQLYPSLDEIIHWCNSNETESVEFPLQSDVINYSNIAQYINCQRTFLRSQFMAPLRALVRFMNQKRSIQCHSFAFRNVQIMLNKNLSDAHTDDLLFVDVLDNKERAAGMKLSTRDRSDLEKLKTGSLLCLTTNYDFENLILATVVGFNRQKRVQGYIGINVMRQFNIENIYEQKYIMFETPMYFETYQKAHRHLTNASVLNFPMENYIIRGSSQLKATQSSSSIYESQKFTKMARQLPLNETQREAFHYALNNDFSLIQGPPGTGKTHLSLQLVKTILEHGRISTPIVIVAGSIDSLDKFLYKLSAHTDSIFRLGPQSRLPEIAKFNWQGNSKLHMINPLLKRLFWMVNLEITDYFQELQSLHANFNGTDAAYKQILVKQRMLWNAQEKLASIRMIFQYYPMVKKKVFALTTNSAARINFVFRLLKSRTIIIDGAAGILESHILPCLSPYTERVIMLGGQMPLKPYESLTVESLFERLILSKFPVKTLNVQYRMSSAIGSLLQRTIYENLYNHESVYKFPNVRGMMKNVFFVSHSQEETVLHNGQICNYWEQQKVFELVAHLLHEGGYKNTDVMVLSPFALQVELLKKKFSSVFNLRNICITTIDSFRGLEANIVVLSLVRSNTRDNIGCLGQIKKISDALSRARYGLYGIGHMTSLERKSSTWSQICSKLKESNSIGLEFPYAAKTIEI